MNSFGRIFRVSIMGESHGEMVGIVIDGCPSGILLNSADFTTDMNRRKGGILKGTTPRQEEDLPKIRSGVFNNHTTGAPIFIEFENKNTRSVDYLRSVEIPRPGHADLVAQAKYNGFNDYRGGGHFSGRLTVALVAAGVVAKKILPEAIFTSKILEIGGCLDLNEGINKAINAKDSIGGIVECVVKNLPIGLGEHFFDSVESLISHIVFSIPAVKGIEFGNGFKSAKLFGSQNNDGYSTINGDLLTNNCGGVLGGITTGSDLIFRVAIKPTSSTPKPQQSINLKSKKLEEFSVKGRHDLCIALRVPVILEAVSAIVLADLTLLDQHISHQKKLF